MMRKLVLAAVTSLAVAGAANANSPVRSGVTQTDAQKQCVDDIEVLWAVADTYKADHNAYEESVNAVLRPLGDSDPRRARTIRLVALIQSDVRFQHFAIRDYADQMENTCANPAQRFDPFNWDGKVPPGHGV